MNKCQKCDKVATYVISELMGSKPKEHHFCEEHAREYLGQLSVQGGTAGNLVSALSQGLPKKMAINKTTEELQELDQQTCPICGVSFYDFRSRGYLGCPHDYDFFHKQIDAFIQNIHGAKQHTGKVPIRKIDNTQERMILIKHRRDLEDAIQYEDYERAAKLRDKINELETKKRG